MKGREGLRGETEQVCPGVSLPRPPVSAPSHLQLLCLLGPGLSCTLDCSCPIYQVRVVTQILISFMHDYGPRALDKAEIMAQICSRREQWGCHTADTWPDDTVVGPGSLCDPPTQVGVTGLPCPQLDKRPLLPGPRLWLWLPGHRAQWQAF